MKVIVPVAIPQPLTECFTLMLPNKTEILGLGNHNGLACIYVEVEQGSPVIEHRLFAYPLGKPHVDICEKKFLFATTIANHNSPDEMLAIFIYKENKKDVPTIITK